MVVGKINGIINPVMAGYVSRVIGDAENSNAAAVVFFALFVVSSQLPGDLLPGVEIVAEVACPIRELIECDSVLVGSRQTPCLPAALFPRDPKVRIDPLCGAAMS